MRDILLENHLMNLLIDLASLHLMFWMEGTDNNFGSQEVSSKLKSDSFTMHVSSDEVSACKKLLENVGLQGYQVNI